MMNAATIILFPVSDKDPKAKDSKKEGKRTSRIVRVVLPVVIAILLILLLGYGFLRRKKRGKLKLCKL